MVEGDQAVIAIQKLTSASYTLAQALEDGRITTDEAAICHLALSNTLIKLQTFLQRLDDVVGTGSETIPAKCRATIEHRMCVILTNNALNRAVIAIQETIIDDWLITHSEALYLTPALRALEGEIMMQLEKMEKKARRDSAFSKMIRDKSALTV